MDRVTQFACGILSCTLQKSDSYRHPKYRRKQQLLFYELHKTVHKMSGFHIETIASSEKLSNWITERLMFSCIHTIKINWVVCERTKKSCNLIMIIGLIWCDDNFFHLMLCLRQRAGVRKKIWTDKVKNLHNLNFECYWRNDGSSNCDGQTASYDLLMSFHQKEKLWHHPSNKETQTGQKIMAPNECITYFFEQVVDPFHCINRSGASLLFK